MNTSKHGWCWAYNTIISYHVSRRQAAYRALRYWLTGDTGVFRSHGGLRRSRLCK